MPRRIIFRRGTLTLTEGFAGQWADLNSDTVEISHDSTSTSLTPVLVVEENDRNSTWPHLQMSTNSELILKDDIEVTSFEGSGTVIQH
ncbi:hypothetical protein GEMRC1_003200 [Eukaryota sp. GEM-RC1]